MSVVGSYALTVWLILSLNFALPRALPGDPITAMVAESAASGAAPSSPDAATTRGLTSYYGLDRRLISQYGHYLASLARGDLGVSIRHRGVHVTELIIERLPWTALLAVTAMMLASALGVAAGIAAGWRRGRHLDLGLLGIFVTVQQVPAYFLASAAAYLFAVQLGWAPLAGAMSDPGPLRSLSALKDVATHLALPASVLAVHLTSATFLLTRAGMVSELGADYLLGGRAKGLSERRLEYSYAGRNALLPVVSQNAMVFGGLISGAIFVELVFSYPGLGTLMQQAIIARDYPVIQGCFLVVTLAGVSCNFIADLAYGRLDPRTAR